MEALLLAGAFMAGFVDAVVGGGGLVQIPLLFSAFPNASPGSIFGTNKLSSVFGTGVAALRYARRVDIPWGIVLPSAISAFAFSYFGARALAWFSAATLKPLILVLLIAVALYTFARKDFGRIAAPGKRSRYGPMAALTVGGVLGFYDGFFGPGTGSFLIFVYVRFFGLDFLRASAASKIVNIATNVAALSYFIPNQSVLLAIGFGMGLCNVLGAICGTHFALKRGTDFVRSVFLAVVSTLIFRFAWDLLS